jgi:uncharacterized membrane protein (Fun14 family)
VDTDPARLEALRRGMATLLADFTRDRPPWRSRTVRWAAALVVLGLGLAAWDTGEGSAPGLDPGTWPLPLRVGLSYIGGFGVGWCMRRFLRLTLLGLLAAGIVFFLLRLVGLEGGLWSNLEELVSGGLSAAREEARAVAEAAKRVLPSAGSATLGACLGWFYRVREPEPKVAPAED